jgi:hypothetical protein
MISAKIGSRRWLGKIRVSTQPQTSLVYPQQFAPGGKFIGKFLIKEEKHES